MVDWFKDPRGWIREQIKKVTDPITKKVSGALSSIASLWDKIGDLGGAIAGEIAARKKAVEGLIADAKKAGAAAGAAVLKEVDAKLKTIPSIIADELGPWTTRITGLEDFIDDLKELDLPSLPGKIADLGTKLGDDLTALKDDFQAVKDTITDPEKWLEWFLGMLEEVW